MGVGKGIDTFEDLKGGKVSGGGLGGRNTWIQREILKTKRPGPRQ